jgi:hypothetical protein
MGLAYTLAAHALLYRLMSERLKNVYFGLLAFLIKGIVGFLRARWRNMLTRYMRSYALITGTPPVQSDLDIGIELPRLGLNSIGCSQSSLYFQLMCRQALIRSKAFQLLYSAKALASPYAATQKAIKELNRDVELWKQRNPFLGVAEDSREDNIYRLMQHLSYYNSLILINQRCWWDKAAAADGSKVLEYSVQICVDAACVSIELLEADPWRMKDYSG